MKMCGNFFSILVLLVLAFPVKGQLTGKIKHLPGTWKYEGGSGYEIWMVSGDEMIGHGYRTTKFKDTMKVEDLRISSVNRSLIYSLTTYQPTEAGNIEVNYRFIGNKRDLNFTNIENEAPSFIRYKFGLFNKRKLRILIGYEGENKPVKLKLEKVSL